MSLRIAIAKPDWGIVGGFELLMDQLARRLEADGHHIRWVQPKVEQLTRRAFGRPTAAVGDRAPAFAQYMELADRFASLDLRRADVVISAMPPSYSIDHERHVAVFSHHIRPYYDLSDVLIEARMIPDVDFHRAAQARVRDLDAFYLGRTPRILATSEEVAGRLAHFNGLHHNVGVFHAGLGFRDGLPKVAGEETYDHVLCVGRHEFPKRTELFVQAAHLAPAAQFLSVGAGGRLGWAKQLDDEFTRGSRDVAEASRALWCTDASWIDPMSVPDGRVRFEGHVSTDDLDDAYRRALCVVAPAYLEDYGLTAIEAMAYGKPLIVCDDGGNLTNFVEDGVNGFVVPPTGSGIAEGVQRLVDDPVLAVRLGSAAREMASTFTWQRTMCEFNVALDEAMSL